MSRRCRLPCNRRLRRKNRDPTCGTGHHFAWPRRPSCPCFPGKCRGILVSDQVRRTTVAPWSFRNRLDALCGEQERGRSVSLPRSAYPWKAPTEAQTRFSEDPAKPILQDGDQSSTARHYRQAKHDSQNLLNIATGVATRQPLQPRFSDPALAFYRRQASAAFLLLLSAAWEPQLDCCGRVSNCGWRALRRVALTR